MDCAITNCLRPIFRNGLCEPHYRERNAKPCSVEGCEKLSHKAGCCEPHYRDKLAERSPPCAVSGCERPAVANGLCNSHRVRQSRHGNLDPTRPHDWGGKRSHPLYHSWGHIKRKTKEGDVVDPIWLKDFWAFVADVGEKPAARYKLKLIDRDGPYNKENYVWTMPVLNAIQASNHKEYQRKYIKSLRDNYPEKFAAYELRKHFKNSRKKGGPSLIVVTILE